MNKKKEFQEIFDILKIILERYSRDLVVEKNETDEYCIDTKFIMKNKKPIFFAAVKIGKNYVSYHLMPVYVFPGLLKDISPELTNHMHGKSCFNFKSVEKELFDELTTLTKTGYLEYKKAGYV